MAESVSFVVSIMGPHPDGAPASDRVDGHAVGARPSPERSVENFSNSLPWCWACLPLLLMDFGFRRHDCGVRLASGLRTGNGYFVAVYLLMPLENAIFKGRQKRRVKLMHDYA